uniref:PSI domain-containing protein n=1 Tax=Amphimedon queenslandica TaxID=400682 RepID=A0A1X7U082_AMPQE
MLGGNAALLASGSVITLKIEDCSSATSCSECVSLGDPSCGWCMIENKCSRRPFCHETRQYLTQYKNCTGQSHGNSANSFYFGLMTNIKGWLTVSTLSSLSVTYDITVKSFNYVHNGVVTKNIPHSYVYVPSRFQTHSTSFGERYKGIKIKSDQPISASFYNIFIDHLILPYHEYPGVSQYKYYAVSTSSYHSTYLSQVLLIGCINNTVISIIPTVDLFIPIDVQKSGSDDILVTKGNSHTITLHEGQTLLLGKGNGSDISGTHFISNKPLTVITGHQCGSTPDMKKRFHCHPLQLQVPPTITWGTRFILTNFNNFHYSKSPVPSYLKTVTSQGNTSITIYCNGATNTTGTLLMVQLVHISIA